MRNLALACPGCNLAKGDSISGLADDGGSYPLYNPRAFEPSLLGWHLHFSLDLETAVIRPVTPQGQATVAALNLNAPNRVFARRLQIRAGLIA